MQNHILKYRPDVKKIYEEKVKGKEITHHSYIDLTCLANLAAQVINNCENGHIYFIGRSMEILYDILNSLFSNLPEWQDKISLLPL